jgi:transcription initiation factor TFIIE subunit alpha
LPIPLEGDIDMYRLRDEDMVYIMGMQSKELHKLCGKLREDRFLAV